MPLSRSESNQQKPVIMSERPYLCFAVNPIWRPSRILAVSDLGFDSYCNTDNPTTRKTPAIALLLIPKTSR